MIFDSHTERVDENGPEEGLLKVLVFDESLDADLEARVVFGDKRPTSKGHRSWPTHFIIFLPLLVVVVVFVIVFISAISIVRCIVWVIVSIEFAAVIFTSNRRRRTVRIIVNIVFVRIATAAAASVIFPCRLQWIDYSRCHVLDVSGR